jgi:hypothetical protein
MDWSNSCRWRNTVARVVLAWLALAVAGVPAAQAAPLRVVYPRSAADNDKRGDYYVQLLDLALRKSGGEYTLRPHDVQMVGARMLQKLLAADGIDVTWGPTTREYEQLLLPVKIPLDKGILGWRLFLIRANDRPLFDGIQSLDQLRQLAAGQQREWADTAILRANGLRVVDPTTYDTLTRMLAAGRFQYFPRGVGEIWNEAKNSADLGLEVERHLALHYAAPTYFFVNKNSVALARRIDQGLRAALHDGSFDRLFEQFHGEAIRRARLDKRLVFELNNPLVPNDAPLQQREELVPR